MKPRILKKISKQRLAVRSEYEGIAASHMRFLAYHLKVTLAEAQQMAVVAAAEEILSRELAKRTKQDGEQKTVQSETQESQASDHPRDGTEEPDGRVVGGQ